MNTNREQMWQAYVDGELSACEAAQFETSLSEAERSRLAAEMRFDRALAERLRQGGACPMGAWNRARSLALGSDGGRGAFRARRWAMAGATIAAAAALAFFLSGVSGLFDPAGDANVIHAAASVADLSSVSETGPGWDNARAYLKEKGIRLDIEDHEQILRLMRPHRPIEIIGARQEKLAGAYVTELLVSCCGRPVKIILAPKDSRPARAIGKAAAAENSDIEATRTVDGYVAAVVARHPSHGLVNLVVAEAR